MRAGTITALIGPNGAGKTTAFQCISGVIAPDAGIVTFAGGDVTGWPPDRVTRAVGPNGAGKSTLLKAIAGLLRLKSGEMLLDGTSIAPPPARERARRGIAFVPQEANVFPGADNEIEGDMR